MHTTCSNHNRVSIERLKTHRRALFVKRPAYSRRADWQGATWTTTPNTKGQTCASDGLSVPDPMQLDAFRAKPGTSLLACLQQKGSRNAQIHTVCK